MTWKRFALIGIPTLTLALYASTGAKGDNIVLNGSFEQYTGGYEVSQSPATYAPSQLGTGTSYTQLNGWTLGSGTYAFLENSSTLANGSYSPQFSNLFNLWGPSTASGGVANGLTTSPDGGNFLALDASSSYDGAGISQSLSGLTIGTTYAVSFDWAAAQQHGYDGDTTESLKVTLGNASQSTTTYDLNSHAFSGWMTQTFDFTATSSTETLTFLAQGTPAGVPPFALLDGVSVAAVPEPSALVLLGLGVFGLGACGVRQRMYARRKNATLVAV